ncbi:hypothetical protein M404DRAFT_1009458 [Pisolithus tinctorius Marx 270]|uniref:Transposase domain-containing protein n=1 Tax=Pisolithus tinctorius Marx 270 TaxID=870435 RepID=A0A0C3JZ60_PISTI|nr:hypothetical protein M404DRAFT_1009458 [Pisolithus tinctorius Marx 270]
MLDHGTLTQEDIDIQVYGSELPNLGPNFHSPQSLLAAADYYEAYNAVTAAGAQPLTAYHAHHLPPDPEGRALERAMDNAFTEIQQQVPSDDPPSQGQLAELDDEIPDVDFELDDNADLPDAVNHQEVSEDVPDPFWTGNNPRSGISFEDLSTLPVYLLVVYMMTTWLHLQWHLPRAACNAVLGILSCLILALCPSLSPPFVTLPSAMKVLGLDLQVYELPCCPSCREVYPPVSSLHTQDKCIPCNTSLFLPDQTKRGLLRSKKVPCVKYPYLSLSEQIQSILTIPGVEDSLDEWRTRPHSPGHYSDIFDGEICRVKLKAPDGTLFFANGPHDKHGPNGELRIGVNLGIDCILPGPKEQSPDEIQRFLRPIVSDLLRLWKEGIRVPTPSCPNGRLVRVVLVAVVCDKPAAHKIGGFGSHSHTHFCHNCWICQNDKDKKEAFVRDAFRLRTDKEHRDLGEKYRLLTTAAARKKFVKEFATRFTELSRLPYFDLVNQIIIDPMHNLFLGLVKTHFYNIWVQGKILRPNHELRIFHDLLADFEIPSSCGKLPTDIGVPAGGSLTADQWLLLATVYGPIAIPQLWTVGLANAQQDGSLADRVALIAKQESEKKSKEAKKQSDAQALEDARSRGREAGVADTTMADAPDENQQDDIDGKCILHPDDPPNFLKLCAAIRLLIGNSISDQEISAADAYLREYCTELIQLYGSGCLKPNHHYATHTARYVRNFGPLSGFWTFLFERLNKILKSFKTNNHGDGELETTFFNEFHRMCQSSRLVYSLRRRPEGSLGRKVSEIMLKASVEERGTVAALAALSNDLNEAHVVAHSIPLDRTATFFDYVIVGGRRYHASRTLGSRNSSLVHVAIPQRNGQPPVDAYGELLEIFRFNQDIHFQGESMYFLRARWFKRWNGDREDMWVTR